MTLPPEKLGDQGQRYVVQTTGYPDPEKKGWQDIGYTNSREDALAMMRGIEQLGEGLTPALAWKNAAWRQA